VRGEAVGRRRIAACERLGIRVAAKGAGALAVAHRVGDLAAPAVVEAHREPRERGVARRARPEVDPERVGALRLLVGRRRGLGQRQQALARRLGTGSRMREARPEVA